MLFVSRCEGRDPPGSSSMHRRAVCNVTHAAPTHIRIERWQLTQPLAAASTATAVRHSLSKETLSAGMFHPSRLITLTAITVSRQREECSAVQGERETKGAIDREQMGEIWWRISSCALHLLSFPFIHSTSRLSTEFEGTYGAGAGIGIILHAGQTSECPFLRIALTFALPFTLTLTHSGHAGALTLTHSHSHPHPHSRLDIDEDRRAKGRGCSGD